jgi:hypothetical protein
MTVATMDRNRALKAAGAAAAAAPYVRRLVSDDRLRAELRNLIQSANHLYSELAENDTVDTLLKDSSIRKDVDHMLESMQKAGQRAMKQRRSTNWLAITIVSGVAGAIAALLVYPRTRHSIQSAASSVQSTAVNLRHGSLHAVDEVKETAEDKAAA